MANRRRMRKNLTDDQLAAYEEAFKLFDSNGDGQIEFSELKTVFNMMGDKDMSDERIRQGILAVDQDGNQTIDLDEFIEMMEENVIKSKPIDPDEELREVFKMFDADGDGSISAAEIHSVLLKFGQKLSREEIEMMLDEADEDGNKCVDFEEFKKLMRF